MKAPGPIAVLALGALALWWLYRRYRGTPASTVRAGQTRLRAPAVAIEDHGVPILARRDIFVTPIRLP